MQLYLKPLKISVKEFVFSRVTDLQPVTFIFQGFRTKALMQQLQL